MSRIGKIPVILPKEAKAAVENGAVTLEGPKGKLTLALPRGIKVGHQEGRLIVSRTAQTKQHKSNHGTIRAILANMVTGVIKGHKKDLEIQGVGFRGLVKGHTLVLNLGFSHPVEFEVPAQIKVAMPLPTSITIEGADMALVGQVAANIRRLKPPEPYKGKGIRYAGEIVRRKQGKSVTK